MATSATRDYYQVLGVPRSASDKDIRAAYRRLARKYHPDLNPGDRTAESRFKELQNAYDVLSDEEKRKKYDQFGPNWEHVEQARNGFSAGFGQGQAAPGGVHFDFGEGGDLSDILEGILGNFGGNARQRAGFRPRAQPAQDIEQHVEITLEEAYSGAVRVVSIPQRNGSVRRFEIKIPAGVRTGARIRLPGSGSTGAGNASPGDLYLNVTVRPHGVFERKDDDLHLDVSVPLATAMLGGEILIPTVKGTRVALKIPSETQNDRVMRLAGQGMPHQGQAGNGDLYVKVKVSLPTSLTARERELFEELRRLRP
jgi:DnaJ-class molecular chaperone